MAREEEYHIPIPVCVEPDLPEEGEHESPYTETAHQEEVPGIAFPIEVFNPDYYYTGSGTYTVDGNDLIFEFSNIPVLINGTINDDSFTIEGYNYTRIGIVP